MQGFTGMIFRAHEKIPGTLRMASKSYFFQRKLLKEFFFSMKTKLYLVDDSGLAKPVLKHISKS